MKDDIINKISPREALEILRHLAKLDKETKNRIIEIAEDLFKDIDVEEIGEDVFYALDGIDVQDLWDNSGAKTNGYISTEEMAFGMVEEQLKPFYQELFRLCELNMAQEAMQYCMGVLKGLYLYVNDSESEFKDWATDIPEECFRYLIDEWEKRCKRKSQVKEMKLFLRKECHKWSEWANKIL
jgi:DNA phosphorothioation-dependent restriction protein DptG